MGSADANFAGWYGNPLVPIFADVADPDVWYFKPATYLGRLAYTSDADSVTNAFKTGTFHLSLRYRYEFVDVIGFHGQKMAIICEGPEVLAITADRGVRELRRSIGASVEAALEGQSAHRLSCKTSISSGHFFRVDVCQTCGNRYCLRPAVETKVMREG